MANPEVIPSLSGIDLPLVTHVDRRVMLRVEHEVLGAYVTEHPFGVAAAALKGEVDCALGDLTPEVEYKKPLHLAGMVVRVRKSTTRDSKPFCIAQVEDLGGGVEVVIWPDVYAKQRDLWTEGKILRFVARVRERNEQLSVSVLDAHEWEPAEQVTHDDASIELRYRFRQALLLGIDDIMEYIKQFRTEDEEEEGDGSDEEGGPGNDRESGDAG